MTYNLFELSENIQRFISKAIENKKNDKCFILDDIQEFKFSVSIINGVMHQKITHCQKTYGYSNSYWLETEYPIEGNVFIDLSSK